VLEQNPLSVSASLMSYPQLNTLVMIFRYLLISKYI